MDTETLRRQPIHLALDEEMVRQLVHGFYTRVRADAEIGPIFDKVIADGWDSHLVKMCDFWSSVMLMTGRYKGAPMLAHMRLKMVRPEHFERWLILFRQTAREICQPDIAELFIVRAENIARSFQLGMFFKPGNADGPATAGPDNKPCVSGTLPERSTP